MAPVRPGMIFSASCRQGPAQRQLVLPVPGPATARGRPKTCKMSMVGFSADHQHRPSGRGQRRIIGAPQTQLHWTRGQTGGVDFRGVPIRGGSLPFTLINNPTALLKAERSTLSGLEPYAYLKIGPGLPGRGHFPVKGLRNFAAVQEL